MIDLLQITFALPIHLQRHKLTLGSVVIASSSTVPETLGSVVTSKDFLSELNWREKHEDIEEKEEDINSKLAFWLSFSFEIVFGIFNVQSLQVWGKTCKII